MNEDDFRHFRDEYLDEMLGRLVRMRLEIQSSLADIPRHEWTAVKIAHLQTLEDREAKVRAEIARRRAPRAAPGTASPLAGALGAPARAGASALYVGRLDASPAE